MEQTAHLWLFFVLVFGVVVLPGLDMAFVLASSLTGGCPPWPLVYGTIALAAGRARGWLESNPAANVAAARLVGGLMTFAAAVTVYEGWRSV